jgi:hypothetical protein
MGNRETPEIIIPRLKKPLTWQDEYIHSERN